jgi:septal ring factor EnvC (AmiA/AmiB activator)
MATTNKSAGDAAKTAAKSTPTAAASVAITAAPATPAAPEEEDTDDPVVLKQRLAQRDERIDSLSESLVNANEEIEGLQEQLTDERQRSGDLAADLNESETLTEELQTKNAELQAKVNLAATIQAESDTLVVTDGTDAYKVLVKGFKFDQVSYRAEELKENEVLVKALVAAGVGFLQKIEPKKEA